MIVTLDLTVHACLKIKQKTLKLYCGILVESNWFIISLFSRFDKLRLYNSADPLPNLAYRNTKSNMLSFSLNTYPQTRSV